MKRFFCHLAVILFLMPFVGCPARSVPVVEVEPLPVSTTSLLEQVRRTLQVNKQTRTLTTDVHGAWQILHGVLAYGQGFEIQTNAGEQHAVEYLLAGGPLEGFAPVVGDPVGPGNRRGLRMDVEPTSKIGQGHRDQWLAVLVQAGLRPDETIRVGSDDVSMLDWVNQAEYDVPLNFEYEFSWTLIAVTAYRPTTNTWIARDGIDYSTELLLEVELSQGIEEAVCGGTHRLIGIAMTLAKRKSEGAELTGVWANAQATVDAAIRQARANQNPDGSYSTSYMHRNGWTRDLGQSIGTTGHVLEFLAIAADDSTLAEPWVELAVRRLCHTLERCDGVDLECGVLYHALHGLSLYESRMTSREEVDRG